MRKTLRKTLSVFLSVLLLLSATAIALPFVGAITADAELTLNTPLTITLDVNSSKYLKFTPAIDGEYVLTSPDASVGCSVWLYTESDPDNNCGYGYLDVKNSFSKFDLVGGETYYFQIYYYDGEVPYTFSVEIMTPDTFGMFVATPIEQNETKEVTVGDGHSYFAFTPSATGYYVFCCNNSESNAYVELFDADLAQYAYDFGTSVSLNGYLESGQTYYFRVHSFSVQTFDVTVELWADQVAASATPLTLDVPQEVTLSNNYSELCWLSFTPPADGEYIFNAENESWFNTNFYNSSMNSMYCETMGNAPRAYRFSYLTEGETYFFALKTSETMAPFNVTMQTTASFIASLGATVLTEGTAAAVTVNQNYKNCWLSFTPEETGTYTLSADNSEYVDCTVYFCNPSSFNVLSSTPLVYTMTLEAGTTYYYSLTCNEAQNINVTMQTVTDYTAGMHPIVLTENEAQAVALAEGGEKVLLQFSPAASGKYFFVADNGNSVGFDLYDESFGYVGFTYFNSIPMERYADLEAGKTYNVMLSSDTAQTFNVTAKNTAHYLDGIGATALTLNTQTQAALVAQEAGKTWFSFTPAESGSYTLSGNNTEPVYLNVYDDSFSYFYGNGNTEPLRYAYRLSAGTTYYFALTSYYEQNIAVKIQTTDDYMSDQATVLTLDTSATAAAGGETMYSFTAASTGIYVFDFTGSGFDASIYDSNMNSSYIYSSGSYPIRMLSGEKRYLRVNPYSNDATVTVTTLDGIGAQQLTLNTPATVTGNVWQFFTYTASESGRYYFVGKNSTPFNARNYYLSGGFSDYSGQKILIETSLNKGETCVFSVRGSSADDTGTFTLFSQNDYFASVTRPIALDTPEAVNYGEMNYFSFTPEITAAYTFYDTQRTSLTIHYGNNSSVEENGSVSVKMEAGKTYTLTAYGGYSNDTVTLSTTASFMASQAIPLVLNEVTPLTFDHGTYIRYLIFTPEETGRYNLSGQNSSGNISLFDSDMNELGSEYDSEFTLSASLEAGKTYYYRIRSYNEQSTEVVLTRGCDHANSHVIPAVPATCTADGKTVAVYCDDCNTWLFEAWKVPKGHKDANRDRVCDICGEPAVEFVAPCNDEGTVTATLYTDGELIVTGEGAITKAPGVPENADEGEYVGYVSKMSKVKELVLPEGITSVCEEAFSHCQLNKLVIPASCTSIESGAFSSSVLEDLTIKNKALALNGQFPIPCYTSYFVNGQETESPIKTVDSYQDFWTVFNSIQLLFLTEYEFGDALVYLKQEFGLTDELAEEVFDNVYQAQIGMFAAEMKLDLPDGASFSTLPSILINNINTMLGTSFTSFDDMVAVPEGEELDPNDVHPSAALENAIKAKFGIDSLYNMPDLNSVPLAAGNIVEGRVYTACEGVTIRGICGSTAKSAANAFGATFDVLSHNPGEPVQEDLVEATETAEGSYNEVIYCTTCGTELSREPKTLPVLTHEHTAGDPVTENEVPATCTKAGSYDEVVYCTGCGQELSRNIVPVQKTAHTPGTPFVTNRKDKTCTEDGSYDTVTLCTVCGALLSSEPTTIEATGHVPGEAVAENKTVEDCTAGGTYDEVVYCTVCNREISRTEKEIAPKAHTPGAPTRENEVPATCGAEGSYTEVITCTVCGKVISRENKTVGKLAHVWGEWTIVKEATVDEAGLERRVCANDSSHVEERPIDKLPPATEPTNPTNPTNPQPDQGGKNLCKYCGQEHTGFLGFFVKIFHAILALFGLHK